MADYYSYTLEDGTILMIESGEATPKGTLRSTSYGIPEDTQERLQQDFEKALGGVKKSLKSLQAVFDEASPDELEVTFGIKAAGEAGNFAIAKASAEVNYQVKTVWKNPAKKSAA